MLRQPLLYPAWYPWFVALAALDVVFTGALLGVGGSEVNVIARKVIGAAGLPGALALKFATVIIVVLICEFVGRRSPSAGRRLAAVAVVLNFVPVAVGAALLAEYAALMTAVVR
jgi:hypothetical protein